MWKKLREAIFSRPIEELQTIVEDGEEISPKEFSSYKPSNGRKPLKLYTTKDGLLIETTRKHRHRPSLPNPATNSSSSIPFSLENESESTATGQMDRARRQMRERVLNKTGMPDIQGKLRESPLFPRRPYIRPRVDTTVVIATKSKGNPLNPSDPNMTKSNGSATKKLNASTTNIPKLDVVATSIDEASPLRTSVSGAVDDSKTGKVGHKVRVRDVKNNSSAPLPEVQRRNNLKDIDNQPEEEPMVFEKKCIDGNTVKFASRPSKCAWSIHPVYKWEAPSFFQRAFLPSLDSLETLLNKQVLIKGELTYLLGCVRASHFGSSTNPGFYITSGFYIWVTDFDAPELISSRKLRVKLEIHGIKKTEVNSDDIYVRVYQLSKVDHGLIGRVHEMIFPNTETELKPDLKGETKLKVNSSDGVLRESSKDDSSSAAEVRKVTSLNSSLTSVKKISNSSNRNMNFIRELDEKSEQRRNQSKDSSISTEFSSKANQFFPTSIKIDVTKIFSHRRRPSDIQLWVTLERTDPQSGNQNVSLLGNKKSMGLPPFLKFKGVQFIYERALVMNKN